MSDQDAGTQYKINHFEYKEQDEIYLNSDEMHDMISRIIWNNFRFTSTDDKQIGGVNSPICLFAYSTSPMNQY